MKVIRFVTYWKLNPPIYELKSHLSDFCWRVVHRRTFQLIVIIWLVDGFQLFIYLIKVFKMKLTIELPNLIYVYMHAIKYLK